MYFICKLTQHEIDFSCLNKCPKTIANKVNDFLIIFLFGPVSSLCASVPFVAEFPTKYVGCDSFNHVLNGKQNGFFCFDSVSG